MLQNLCNLRQILLKNLILIFSRSFKIKVEQVVWKLFSKPITILTIVFFHYETNTFSGSNRGVYMNPFNFVLLEYGVAYILYWVFPLLQNYIILGVKYLTFYNLNYSIYFI